MGWTPNTWGPHVILSPFLPHCVPPSLSMCSRGRHSPCPRSCPRPMEMQRPPPSELQMRPSPPSEHLMWAQIWQPPPSELLSLHARATLPPQPWPDEPIPSPLEPSVLLPRHRRHYLSALLPVFTLLVHAHEATGALLHAREVVGAAPSLPRAAAPLPIWTRGRSECSMWVDLVILQCRGNPHLRGICPPGFDPHPKNSHPNS